MMDIRQDTDIRQNAELRRRFQESFPLAKRMEKEASQLDVKIFLSFLKKHKLFGSSLRDELADLYDLINESWHLAGKIKEGKAGSKDKDLLEKLTLKIEHKSKEILDKLEEGRHILIDMRKKLWHFINNEEQLLSVLTKKRPVPPQVMHAATMIQGALNDIKPLFEAISTAYEKRSLDISAMIDEEVLKIQENLKRGNAERVDFKRILSHVKEVEQEIDDLIAKEEKRIKLSKVTEKNTKLIEKAVAHILEQETPPG